MAKKIIFLVCCLMAAAAPFWPVNVHTVAGQPVRFPGWPMEFQQAKLKPLPLTTMEKNFYRDFPGAIRKYATGERRSRVVIFRWITGITRSVHSAAECFQGSGYRLAYLPLHQDASQTRWSSFTATRNGLTFIVYERIYDTAGGNWTDTSSWYWAAVFGKTKPPWWAVTFVERR